MRQFLAATLLLLLFGVPAVLLTDGHEVMRELNGFARSVLGHGPPATTSKAPVTPIIRPGIAWLAPLATQRTVIPIAKNDHTLDDLQSMAVNSHLGSEVMRSDPATLDEIQRFALRAEKPNPVSSVAPTSFLPIVVVTTSDTTSQSAPLDSTKVTSSVSYPPSPAPDPLRRTHAAIPSDGSATASEAAVATSGSGPLPPPATADPDRVLAAPARGENAAGTTDAPQSVVTGDGGDVSAILVRARQYVEGGEVARNYPLAYFWYEVAASRAPTAAVRADAIARRDRVTAAMTAEESVVARGLVSYWLAGSGDNVAGGPPSDLSAVAPSAHSSLIGPVAR